VTGSSVTTTISGSDSASEPVTGKSVYRNVIKTLSYVCQPTDVCLEETQVFNRSYEECCPGFRARRRTSTTSSYYSRSHYRYYSAINSRPEGCPIAEGDSLLECLRIQGLDDFISYIEHSVYFTLLNETTSTHITLFAPTNEALATARVLSGFPDPNTDAVNVSNIVGNHIVPGNVTMTSLRQHGSKIYVNVEGRNLHRTSVSITDSSYVSRPENSYQYNLDPGTSAFQTVIPFINGAEVVIADACHTVNATLHIIDRVLLPAEGTIAEFLQNNPLRFSMFKDALETVGILPFLNNPNVSRTVFAVQNDAFNEALPPGLLACIGNYMRPPFNNLLQFHIGQGAYYSSVLALENFFYTNLGKFIRVQMDEETGEILLGPCKVAIIEADIVSASNGVVHVIEKFLFPENFDFMMCSTLVPDPSPAECPPEEFPSPSPTMDFPPNTSSFDSAIFPTPGSQFFFGR
jgi:uncharacterized surface protein with fasciclin (FAS1) repeats